MAPRDRETDTHSNLVGGREGRTSFDDPTHRPLSLSLSSSRPRGLLFPHFPTDVSLNDTVLIYCPSPHDKREKMLREGTEKILSRRGTRGEDGRKVKKMLLMLQSCLFAVVVVTLSPGGGLRPVDPLYI